MSHSNIAVEDARLILQTDRVQPCRTSYRDSLRCHSDSAFYLCYSNLAHRH